MMARQKTNDRDYCFMVKTFEPGVVLNKVLHVEAPPGGPNPFPLIYLFLPKSHPFHIPRAKLHPFVIPQG